VCVLGLANVHLHELLKDVFCKLFLLISLFILLVVISIVIHLVVIQRIRWNISIYLSLYCIGYPIWISWKDPTELLQIGSNVLQYFISHLVPLFF
jgi:hypothetical protein